MTWGVGHLARGGVTSVTCMDHLAGHVLDLPARVVIDGHVIDGGDLYRRGDQGGFKALAPGSVTRLAVDTRACGAIAGQTMKVPPRQPRSVGQRPTSNSLRPFAGERSDQGPCGAGSSAARRTQPKHCAIRAVGPYCPGGGSDRIEQVRPTKEVTMNPAAYMTRIAGRSLGLGTAVAASRSSASCSSGGLFALKDRFSVRWHHSRRRRGTPAMTIYQLTDRLHDGRIARVPGDEIADTVSRWLTELGA